MTRRGKRARRGTTAILAMLYLILFSMLALGFYAASTTAIQVTANDDRAARALLAAESGMEYMRFVLSDTSAPAGKSGMALLSDVKTALAAQLEPTANFAGRTIGWDGGSRITIPDITLGTNLKFNATVQLNGPGDRLVVTTTGISGNRTTASRAVSMEFPRQTSTAAIFNYGVASKSAVSMHNNATITGVSDDAHGAILISSTVNPDLEMDNHSVISGDVNLVDAAGTIDKTSSADIVGNTNLGVSEPEFPAIDTSAFEPYATTVLTDVDKKYKDATLTNIRIAANTNPIFDSGMKIDGVIYIETPNKVEFKSNCEIRGVIAVENNPTGDTTTNAILLDSGVKMTGVETLPATSDFPAALRAMTGSLILAPTFLVHMHSNAGTTGGSIVAGKIEMHSNANITVTGSVINLDSTGFWMHSNSRVHIQRPEDGYSPAGMAFSDHFAPDITTYVED